MYCAHNDPAHLKNTPYGMVQITKEIWIFTEVLGNFFPAYDYITSLTYMQLKFNNRQRIETEQIL